MSGFPFTLSQETQDLIAKIIANNAASQWSAGYQSLVQIILSGQNMPTNPNIVTDTLVSPLAPMNILEPSNFNLTQNMNDVLPMNPMFPNTRNTTMPIPENSIQGFGTQSSEPFFFYSDDIKLYQDPLTAHSRGCLFNPTVNLRPQYVELPPGTNETIYFEWFIGEGKGNFRDAVASWNQVSQEDQKKWGSLAKRMRREHRFQLNKGQIKVAVVNYS